MNLARYTITVDTRNRQFIDQYGQPIYQKYFRHPRLRWWFEGSPLDPWFLSHVKIVDMQTKQTRDVSSHSGHDLRLATKAVSPQANLEIDSYKQTQQPKHDAATGSSIRHTGLRGLVRVRDRSDLQA